MISCGQPSAEALQVELPPVDASILKAAELQASSVGPQQIQIKPGVNELMPIAVGHLSAATPDPNTNSVDRRHPKVRFADTWGLGSAAYAIFIGSRCLERRTGGFCFGCE